MAKRGDLWQADGSGRAFQTMRAAKTGLHELRLLGRVKAWLGGLQARLDHAQMVLRLALKNEAQPVEQRFLLGIHVQSCQEFPASPRPQTW